MTEEKLKLIEELINAIPELTEGQLYWMQRIVVVFSGDHQFTLECSDILDDVSLQNFGDAIRIHHSFSAEPFSKDKFEYVFVKILNMSGHVAFLAPKGNPGHDATMDGIKLSLKTQADKGIKTNFLWISKFMELGKGDWEGEVDNLKGLRDQFLQHLQNYDRILSLRALSKGPDWKYELVEIPKSLLFLAKDGDLKMMSSSKQFPKPGYCYARDGAGNTLFELYFDAGSERKLQIKNLDKCHCVVHAVWRFVIPPE